MSGKERLEHGRCRRGVEVVGKEQGQEAPAIAEIQGAVCCEVREGPGRGRCELASAVAKLSWATCLGGLCCGCQGRAVLVGLKGCLEGSNRGQSNKPGSLAPFSATRERELLTLGERVWDSAQSQKRCMCSYSVCPRVGAGLQLRRSSVSILRLLCSGVDQR